MGKVNLRLNKPSSHTRLWSRLTILDIVWGALSPLAAFVLRDGTIFYPKSVGIYCGIAFLASVLVFQWYQTSSPIARFYSIRDALQLVKACFLIAIISAVAAFILTRLDEAPRSIPILHFLVLVAGLAGARVLWRLRDTRREARERNIAVEKVEHVVIIQATRLAWFFSKMLEEIAPGQHQIVAILDEQLILNHRTLNGYPIIGTPADLETVVADYALHGVQIDKVVVAVQPGELAAHSWEEVRRVCRIRDIDLEILPERLMSKEPAIANDDIAIGQQLEPIVSQRELPLDRPFWKIKRATDCIVALVGAVMISPVLLLLSALVLLDVGVPIVFWQQRIGRNSAPLHLYKFRTLQTLFHPRTKERRDTQHCSWFGRFLQKSHLDELPQLWNVFGGDMSLIGPRPLLPDDQPNDLSVRLSVRPGLTGWAQVCGGKKITVDEKTALDEWYIRHASFRLDVNILLRTLAILLFNVDRRDEKAISIALSETSANNPFGSPSSSAIKTLGEAGEFIKVEPVSS